MYRLEKAPLLFHTFFLTEPLDPKWKMVFFNALCTVILLLQILVSSTHFTVPGVLCDPSVFQGTPDFSSVSGLDRGLSFSSLCSSSSFNSSLNKATSKPA